MSKTLPDQLIESRAQEALEHLSEQTRQEVEAYILLCEKKARESVKVNPPPPVRDRILQVGASAGMFGLGTGTVGSVVYILILVLMAMNKGCVENNIRVEKEEIAKEAIQIYEAECQRKLTELSAHKQRLQEENQKLSQIRTTLLGFCSPESSLQNANSP